MGSSSVLKTIATILILLPILGVGGCFAYRSYQIRQFARLEQNARKVITAEDLQKWALKLISDSHSYTNSEQFRSIRTNYPPQLGRLMPGLTPDVNINEANSINSPLDWTNIPPSVSFIWGSGFLGHRGFMVGPTNFEWSGSDQWAPGVYFFKR